MTPSPAGAAAQHHGPGLPLRRAQEDRGLLRRRRLLLPGHGVHRRGRAAAREPRCAPTSAAPRSRPASSAGRWPTPPSSARWSTTSTAADRKAEPRRIRKVMNNHIGKGGHLSAQPMGALRDFVARDPRTEMPAVVDIPVLRGEPLQGRRAGAPRPHREGAPRAHHPRQEHGAAPRAGVRGAPASWTTRASTRCSCTTWRTCSAWSAPTSSSRSPRAPTSSPAPPTRRSSAPSAASSAHAGRSDEKYELWEAVERRTFPGSVSNHHLGTLLGLLMAAYEMNHFKDAYQQAVIANAKAFAGALRRRRARRRRGPRRQLHRDAPGRRARGLRPGSGGRRRGSRRTTSSATTRRRRTRRASRRPARCAWASPR